MTIGLAFIIFVTILAFIWWVWPKTFGGIKCPSCDGRLKYKEYNPHRDKNVYQCNKCKYYYYENLIK